MGKVLAQWVKVLIEGLGAIERVEVELKPLTVIVSKCTYFSSSLITALYLLASSYPDFSKLNDFTVTEISRLCERAYSSALKSNIQMLEEYTRKIFDLYLDGIGRLIAGSLSRRFKEFFNVDAANKVLKGFIKVFSDEAPYHVEIEPRGLDLAVSFKPLDKPLAKVEGLRHLGDGLGLSLSLLIGERELARRDMFVKSPLDIASEFAYMTRIFADKLAPISFGSRNSYLFTSDRASIMSDLPIAYGLTLGYGGRRISAKSQALISSYVEAAKKFKAELVEQLEADLNLVLEELGVKSFSLRFMASYPMLSLDLSWRDKVLLEDSPMEVRSCMPVVVSLLYEPSDFEVVFIEDVCLLYTSPSPRD